MENFKNNVNKRKFELTVVFLAFFLVALLKIVSAVYVSAEEDSSIPSLFYNDNPFLYSIPGSSIYLPLKQYNGVHYVPLDIFKQLNDIKIYSNDRYTEQFYIQYQNNRYIVFNISAEKAYNQNKEYKNCKIYKDTGIIYVPVKIIADELGLEWEYKAEYNAGRIKEAGAKRSFDSLLEKYLPKPQPTTAAPPQTTQPPTPNQPPQPSRAPVNPPTAQTEPPVEYTTEPPDPPVVFTTEPNDVQKPPEPTTKPKEKPKEKETTESTSAETTEPTLPENTEEIQNYLMFYDGGENEGSDKAVKMDEVLEALEKNGNLKAMFFLGGEEIEKTPDILRAIYAAGHGLGIKAKHGGTEELAEELEEVNALIYSVLKHKTRFYILEPAMPEGFDESELVAKGYYLCGPSAVISDLEGITDLDAMVEFLKREKCNVFMLDINGDVGQCLEWFDAASKAKFYIIFSQINNANIESLNKERGQ